MVDNSGNEVNAFKVEDEVLEKEKDTEPEPVKELDLLPFKIQFVDKEISSPTIKLTWCTEIETLNYLASLGLKDPCVVIVVSSEDHYSSYREQRFVVPMKDMMAYIGISSSGKNKIRAFVPNCGCAQAKSVYCCKSLYSGYSTDLFIYDGTEWSYNFQERNGVRQPRIWSELTVDIPKECFAKEPPEWEKEWVNLLFAEKCIDQCQYRRRRIFAYTLQLFLLAPVNMAARLVLLTIAFLYGSQGFSFKYLLHPLTYDMESVMDNLFKRSVFIPTIKEDEECINSAWKAIKYFVKKLCLIPFAPLSIILFIISARYNFFLLLIGIVFAVIIAVMFFFLIGSGLLGKSLHDLYCKLFEDKSDKIWYMDKDEVELLACGDAPKVTKLSDLPAKHKTIKLRFLDLKSKVCKPFSE